MHANRFLDDLMRADAPRQFLAQLRIILREYLSDGCVVPNSGGEFPRDELQVGDGLVGESKLDACVTQLVQAVDDRHVRKVVKLIDGDAERLLISGAPENLTETA